MHFSSKTSLFLLTAAAVAFSGLAACGGGEAVTPVTILPGAPKMSNNKEFVTPIKLTKGADGVSCTGGAATIPMAPGKWKFTANLPSQNASCERDIAGASAVGFKDGEPSCS